MPNSRKQDPVAAAILAWADRIRLEGLRPEEAPFVHEAWFRGRHPWLLATNPARAVALFSVGRHPWSEPNPQDQSGTLGLLDAAAEAYRAATSGRTAEDSSSNGPFKILLALELAAKSCNAAGRTLPSRGILHRCVRDNLPRLFAFVCSHAKAFGIDPNEPSPTGRSPLEAAVGAAAKRSGDGRARWTIAATACVRAGGNPSSAPAHGTAAFSKLCERFRTVFGSDPETAGLVERSLLAAAARTKRPGAAPPVSATPVRL